MENNIRNFEGLLICSPLCLGFSYITKYATILHTKNQKVHGKIALLKSDPNNKQVRAIVSVYQQMLINKKSKYNQIPSFEQNWFSLEEIELHKFHNLTIIPSLFLNRLSSL